MGFTGVYHGLLGLKKGNDMYDGPPTPCFVTGKVLKSIERSTQYGYGFNYNYKK